MLVNILVTRNRKSINWGIRVPVPGNHLFVLDYNFYFYGNICQGLAASAMRSSLYKYPCRNYDSVCTKVNLKSDFHIAGQLMETHPEYSLVLKISTTPYPHSQQLFTYSSVALSFGIITHGFPSTIE